MSFFKAMTLIILRKVKSTTCDLAVIPHSHNQIPTNYPSVSLSDPCLQCEISFFLAWLRIWITPICPVHNVPVRLLVSWVRSRVAASCLVSVGAWRPQWLEGLASSSDGRSRGCDPLSLAHTWPSAICSSLGSCWMELWNTYMELI